MNWIPLQSDPECMNKLLNELGLSSEFGLTDIISLDPDLLQFIIKPVYAVIFLYPINLPNIQDDLTLLNENELDSTSISLPYFIKQKTENVCGTIAIIHALANNFNYLKFNDDSIFKKFYNETVNLDENERANHLENMHDFKGIHQKCATQGESDPSQIDLKSDFHFVCLIEHENYLWKLDGRKNQPLKVAKANRENILEVFAKYCTNFIDKNKSCLNFSALALSRSE